MRLTRQAFGLGVALAASALLPIGLAHAQEKVIKIGAAQDFTKVYTFVTAEYSQGQRDYLTLVNERGGVNGYKFAIDVVDHGNDMTRAIEAYERFKREGVVLVDPLSTPIARGLVPRALQDKINLVTTLSGRSDASDGSAFPFVMPLSPTYWSQAAVLIEYIKQQEKDLKGKKIAIVYIDTPYGREPLPILQVLAEKNGFELATFPYTAPGNDQSGVWPQVRRARPDWTLIWGAGAGQIASLKEAIRNGVPMDRIASVVWLSESEMEVVGKDQAKGVLKFEVAAGGKDPKVIQDIQKDVLAKGKGSGPAEKVGTAYYNIGVMAGALAVEGVRKAFEKSPNGPITSEWLNEGLRSISKFTAEGLLPPVTITKEDHQGGGYGRIAQWDGTKWAPKSDWMTAGQDVVWAEIKKYSEEFKKTGK